MFLFCEFASTAACISLNVHVYVSVCSGVGLVCVLATPGKCEVSVMIVKQSVNQ